MSKAIRIAYVTGHEFGIDALEGMMSSSAFLRGDISFPLIIGLPRDMRKSTVGYSDVREYAERLNSNFIEARDFTLTEYVPDICNLEIDSLMVIGWSYLVSDIAREACLKRISGVPLAVGMHPSPLPVGRGRAPIPWSIIKGLKSTALTVFLLDAEVDSGPILFQKKLSIREAETSTSLYGKFRSAHMEAGKLLGDILAYGPVVLRPQDSIFATYWRKRTRADSEISATMRRAEVMLLFRAQSSPYPRLFMKRGGREIDILDVLYDIGDLNDDYKEVNFADGVLYLRFATPC